MNLAYKYASQATDFDSALSDGMLALWATAKEFDVNKGKFSTLFYEIVNNAGINQWKKEQRDMLPHCTSESLNNHLDRESEEPYEQLLQKNAQESIKECLGALEDIERRVIELFFDFSIDEATIKEYASKVGMTRQNVYNIRDNALIKLKRCLTILEE